MLRAFSIIAIGTMLAAREDERHDFVWPTCCSFLSPADDIQAGLCLVAYHGQSLIDTLAEQAVAFGREAANDKDGASVTFQEIKPRTIAHVARFFH